MFRLFYYDNNWFNIDNDIDSQNLLDKGAIEYLPSQIRGVEGNECWVSTDTMFQDEQGNWYFEKVESQADLNELKEQKHQELKAQRDNLRQTEFAEYDNDTFQIRSEDQDNLNTFYSHAIGMLSGVVQRNKFGLMSATNRLHYFEPEDIVELAQRMKDKVEEIYQRYWYARDVLLENAETKSEIESVQIPLTIPE